MVNLHKILHILRFLYHSSLKISYLKEQHCVNMILVKSTHRNVKVINLCGISNELNEGMAGHKVLTYTATVQ